MTEIIQYPTMHCSKLSHNAFSVLLFIVKRTIMDMNVCQLQIYHVSYFAIIVGALFMTEKVQYPTMHCSKWSHNAFSILLFIVKQTIVIDINVRQMQICSSIADISHVILCDNCGGALYD